MSNDRIFLVCKKCRRAIVLAKYYPGEFTVTHSQEELDDFMQTHQNTCYEITMFLDDDPRFEIVTENGLDTINEPYTRYSELHINKKD
jgi:hypothetical protein